MGETSCYLCAMVMQHNTLLKQIIRRKPPLQPTGWTNSMQVEVVPQETTQLLVEQQLIEVVKEAEYSLRDGKGKNEDGHHKQRMQQQAEI